MNRNHKRDLSQLDKTGGMSALEPRAAATVGLDTQFKRQGVSFQGVSLLGFTFVVFFYH